MVLAKVFQENMNVRCCILAIAASVVSLVRSGCPFDIGNNTFHIPIVLKFTELPQFADDPFVLSLRNFVIPIYPLLSLFATGDNVAFLFIGGLIATHVLIFLALLRIGDACGLRRWLGQAGLALLA